MVLLFDVAKFKYPPHWVPLAALHAAMQAADPATGQPRGYLLLRRRGQGREASGPGGLGPLGLGLLGGWANPWGRETNSFF